MDNEAFKNEEDKRKEFREIIVDLASKPMPPISQDQKDKGTRSQIYLRLESLYYSSEEGKGFRHFYSDIFSTLTMISKSNTENLDILGSNLSDIRQHYMVKNLDEYGNEIDISDCIRKLYDHVNLDIARIRYSEAGDREASGAKSVEDLHKDLNGVREEIEKTQHEMDIKIGNQQKEYIAILGVFAAVVVAFTTGVAFSGSVLENISQSSIYRTVFIVVLIALALSNCIYIMFCFIDRIVNGKLPSLKGLVIADSILIIIAIIVFVFWGIGLVELRNDYVIKNKSYVLFRDLL